MTGLFIILGVLVAINLLLSGKRRGRRPAASGRGPGVFFLLVYWVINSLFSSIRKKSPSDQHPAPLPSRLNPPKPAPAFTKIEFACPACKRVLSVPLSLAGKEGECEGCNAVVSVPALVTALPVPVPVSAGVPPVLPGPHAPMLPVALLRELEWKRFEEVTELYFRLTGWGTQQTRIGPDGGVDINLFRPPDTTIAAVVQCKAWNTYKIGVKPVRELFGVMAAGKIPAGYFVTSGTYTQEASGFAAQVGLTLIDGDGLVGRIQQLPEADRRRIHQLATSGDYKTPTCPRCGEKMLLRTSTKGANIGSQFWGCPCYPRCKATLKIKAAGNG